MVVNHNLASLTFAPRFLCLGLLSLSLQISIGFQIVSSPNNKTSSRIEIGIHVKAACLVLVRRPVASFSEFFSPVNSESSTFFG